MDRRVHAQYRWFDIPLQSHSGAAVDERSAVACAASLCQSAATPQNVGIYGGQSIDCLAQSLDVDRSTGEVRQFSAEAHLDSSFDGPLDVLARGIYFDSKATAVDYDVNRSDSMTRPAWSAAHGLRRQVVTRSPHPQRSQRLAALPAQVRRHFRGDVCHRQRQARAASGVSTGSLPFAFYGSGMEVNVRGNQLPNAPTFKGAVGVQHIDCGSSSFTLVPRADLNYTGDQWSTHRFSSSRRVTAFTLVESCRISPKTTPPRACTSPTHPPTHHHHLHYGALAVRHRRQIPVLTRPPDLQPSLRGRR